MLTPFEHNLLLGHTPVVEHFASCAQRNRLPHGWLFLGGEGIGKRTLAVRLVHRLFVHDPQQISSPQILEACLREKSHPDFVLCEGKGDKPISVDEIRTLKEFLSKKPQSGSTRCVILTRIDACRPSALNALLKLLEEPFSGTYIFLTALCSHAVLPTIRSRCATFHLKGLAPQAFFQGLKALYACELEKHSVSIASPPHPQSSEAHILYRLAQGRIGKGFSLLCEDNWLSILKTLQRSLSPQTTLAELKTLCDIASTNIGLFEEVLLLWGYQAALHSCHLSRHLFWEHMLENCRASLRDARIFHLDMRQTIFSLLLKIRAAFS